MNEYCNDLCSFSLIATKENEVIAKKHDQCNNVANEFAKSLVFGVNDVIYPKESPLPWCLALPSDLPASFPLKLIQLDLFNMGIDKYADLRILSAQDKSIPTRQAMAAKHANRSTIQS
jgi:hypothetical protein